MHGGVDASAQQLVLDFLGEEPFACQLPQRAVDLRIAARLDDDELGGHALARQGRLHPLGLPQRQPAAPRAALQNATHSSPAPPPPSPYQRPTPPPRPPP